MEKIIVKCKKCEKKMKILNKIGKYRCPYCKEVYKLNIITLIFEKIKSIGKGFAKTVIDIKNTVKYQLMIAKNKKKR